MVTARGAPDEPFHRWIHFKQGFSPSLVRLFLKEQADRGTARNDLPVLDPFAGSGTVPIECARGRVQAVGVEALASLAFLADARHEHELPPFPAIDDAIQGETISDDDAGKEASDVGDGTETRDDAEWTAIADRLAHPLHRAALMLAVGRRHTSAGKLNRSADPLPESLQKVLAMIREDVRSRLAISNVTHHGDARQLAMIDDESIGAILTSPPYLSRHDYAAIVAPLDRVYRHWFPADDTDRPRASQMAGRATVRSPNRAAGFSQRDDARPSRAAGFSPRDDRRSGSDASLPDAAREAAVQLEMVGEAKLASVVRAYFVDLARVVAECHRVLAPGGVAWFVVGGSRLKGVHIPSDVIVAEQMQAAGFTVNAIRVAREVTGSRRKFGRLGHIAPRESVIVASKR